MRARLFAAVLVAACVTGLAGVLAYGLGGGAPESLADRPPPRLTGPTLDGGRFALADLRGHLVLVNLWASWCEPCREEFPVIARTARRLGGRGLRVVGVNTRDTVAAARLFLRESGPRERLVHLSDPDGRLALELGAFGVPETFLIGRDGRIVERLFGPVTEQWIDRNVLPRLAS